MSKRTCTVDGCEKPHRAGGWCSGHWQRWKNTGSLGDSPIKKRTGTCKVAACDAPHRALGWCENHYANYRRTGLPLGVRAERLTLAESLVDDITARIPLRAAGSSIKAWTLVDIDEFERVNLLHWHYSKGYAVRERTRSESPNGRSTERLHRTVLGLSDDDMRHVDHINRDRLDNRRRNLRAVSPGSNSQNVPSQGGSSRFRNVYWHARQQSWNASIYSDGQRIHLGSFLSEEDAGECASRARRVLMPYATD